MFGWLRRLFSRRDDGPGYTCDGCETWTPRSKGKALVEVKSPGVHLYCPDCAKLKAYAKKQAEKASDAAKQAEVDLSDALCNDIGPRRNPGMAQNFMNAYGAKTGRESCATPNESNVGKSMP